MYRYILYRANRSRACGFICNSTHIVQFEPSTFTKEKCFSHSLHFQLSNYRQIKIARSVLPVHCVQITCMRQDQILTDYKFVDLSVWYKCFAVRWCKMEHLSFTVSRCKELVLTSSSPLFSPLIPLPPSTLSKYTYSSSHKQINELTWLAYVMYVFATQNNICIKCKTYNPPPFLRRSK